MAIALGNGLAASAEMPRALAAPPIPRSIPWRRTLSTLALAALLLLLHQLEEGLGLHARGAKFWLFSFLPVLLAVLWVRPAQVALLAALFLVLMGAEIARGNLLQAGTYGWSFCGSGDR